MDYLSFLGYSKLSFSHSEYSTQIALKDGSHQTLSELVRDVLPPCRLNPLLFNGHLHTIWAARDLPAPAIHYKRKIFDAVESTYPGSFAVDFVVHNASVNLRKTGLPDRTTYFSQHELGNMASLDSRPMLVVLHGLSGGSHEVYLRDCLGPLVEDRKWEACVVNSRGCAGSAVTSGVLYNARATWDIRQVVKWLRGTFPNRPLYGIGFSIGANIITNYIGEEGEACAFKAAVVCSNPWNLDVSALALQRTWIGLEVYSKAMGTNMKRLVELHKDQVVKHTDIDLDAVRKIRYLHEFDRVVQCPTWGYPTEGAYYRDASCIDTLFAVKIPLLALSADDDPICPREAIPYDAFVRHPYAVLCTTKMGGHLGWFQPGGGRWFTTAVGKFLNKMENDTVSNCEPADEAKTKIQGLDGAYEPMRRRLFVRIPSYYRSDNV